MPHEELALLRRVASCIASGLLASALAACGSSGSGRGSFQVAGRPCGAATAQTLAQTAGLVAMGIYSRERSSAGVRADRSQVAHYRPLLSALASGNTRAVRSAVTRLVFSGSHIVRLRVTRGGAVLADVGGPYVLAPVGGSLRFDGRLVGHYLLSVQDDVGYVKLENRFVGVPLVVREGARRLPLAGTLARVPLAIPAHGLLSYQRVHYESFSFSAQAFPSGSLRITVLVALPVSPPVSSCAQIRVSELGRIAQQTWDRFALISAPPSAYILSVGRLTGGLGYVRAGSDQLAGSTHPGPARLPSAGTVTYQGMTYGVSSFLAKVARRQVRVYELVAQ